jgi:hypothetical protein
MFAVRAADAVAELMDGESGTRLARDKPSRAKPPWSLMTLGTPTGHHARRRSRTGGRRVL